MKKKRKKSLDYREELIIKENKVEQLQNNILKLKERLLDKKPSHFSKKDIARAFFGSIIFGLTFVLKGIIVNVSLSLTLYHVITMMFSTLTIASIEIYYIGYRRLTSYERQFRHFTQFWFKRLFTYYAVALLVSTFLVYIYNINGLVGVTGFWDIFRVIISISLPATVGASVSDLLRQY